MIKVKDFMATLIWYKYYYIIQLTMLAMIPVDQVKV